MNLPPEFGCLGGLPPLEGTAAELCGTYKGKRCLVIGSGACVWDDLDAIGVHGDTNNGWDTMCVNDMMAYYPGVVDHGFSYYYKGLPFWTNGRRETINAHKVVEKWGRVGYTHSRVNAQVNWPWPGHGTSSLGAVYTALALGYDQVVLCGVPLDNGPHFFEPPWCTSNFENECGKTVQGRLLYWHASLQMFQGRVKSMSGRTKELVGAP